MRDNYDQLVKAHQSSTAVNASGDPNEEGIFIPADIKFKVFQTLMDGLFVSFNEKVQYILHVVLAFISQKN